MSCNNDPPIHWLNGTICGKPAREFLANVPPDWPCRMPHGELQAYASRTGCKTTLEAMRLAGWALLVSASADHRTEGFTTYAVDNGAWAYHQRGVAFDASRFRRCVERLGERAQWIVAPDIIQGGAQSLALSLEWLPELLAVGTMVLLPVQDGMTPEQVRPHLSKRVGLFVGGSDPWKERTAVRWWGPLAREVDCYLHVARVNSARRIALYRDACAQSFDGTSPTQFPPTLEPLRRAVSQRHLFHEQGLAVAPDLES